MIALCPQMISALHPAQRSSAIELPWNPPPLSRTCAFARCADAGSCAALVAARSRRTNLCILVTPLVFVLLLVVMQKLVDAAHGDHGDRVSSGLPPCCLLVRISCMNFCTGGFSLQDA